LAMIQAVISRMASNSFALKTLTVTLCAGVVALLGAVQKPNLIYVLAALGPMAVFCWMDARYVRLERLFRHLYDDVSRGVEMQPFDMRVDRYEPHVEPSARIALSWSVGSVYVTLLAVLLIVSAGVLRAT
jgi:hypothetical protein